MFSRDGTLPSYSWLNPRSGINITTGVGASDQHPDHDVAAGEGLDVVALARAHEVTRRIIAEKTDEGL